MAMLTSESQKPLWLKMAGGARNLLEQSLHPWRRRVASARLRRNGLCRSVYFVCEGNIYRSPFGAAVFASLLPALVKNDVRVGSGGFVGPGRSSPPEAVEVARVYGIDLVPHRSSLLHEPMRQDWELVVVMEARQARALRHMGVPAERVLVLGDLDPELPERRTIIDPWKQDERVLSASYDRIERCVRALVQLMIGDNYTLATSAAPSGRMRFTL